MKQSEIKQSGLQQVNEIFEQLQPHSEKYLIASNLSWQSVGTPRLENGQEVMGSEIQRMIMGYDKSLMVAQVKFEKGAVSAPHAHVHAQSTYVVSGKFKVKIGDEEKVLQGGDGFWIPSGVLHGATCLEAGILIDAFSPIRADFIE